MSLTRARKREKAFRSWNAHARANKSATLNLFFHPLDARLSRATGPIARAGIKVRPMGVTKIKRRAFVAMRMIYLLKSRCTAKYVSLNI